jgi:hypothetical protein
MINKIYTNTDIQALTKEITKTIGKNAQVGIDLLFNWLELDNPPPQFFKAWINSLYGKSLVNGSVLDELKEKIVQKEKFDIIKMMINFEMYTMSDFFLSAMNNQKLEVLEYLINEKDLFIRPNIKTELYINCYKVSSPEFFYQAEKLLDDNYINLKQRKNRPVHNFEYILGAIIESGQFEYIDYFEKKHQIIFKNEGIKNYSDYWQGSLNQNFLTLPIQTQCNFIQFFNELEREKSNKSIVKTYLHFRTNENIKIMFQVLDKLIDNKMIKMSELKQIKGLDNVVALYEPHFEQQKLNTAIIEPNKKERKLKL